MKPRLTAAERLDRLVTESELQHMIQDLLDLYKWKWHHTSDSRRSTAGLPDIVAIRPPRVLFAELKRETGRTSKTQEEWLEALGRSPGVETYLWRPSDMDEIVRTLK